MPPETRKPSRPLSNRAARASHEPTATTVVDVEPDEPTKPTFFRRNKKVPWDVPRTPASKKAVCHSPSAGPSAPVPVPVVHPEADRRTINEAAAIASQFGDAGKWTGEVPLMIPPAEVVRMAGPKKNPSEFGVQPLLPMAMLPPTSGPADAAFSLPLGSVNDWFDEARPV